MKPLERREYILFAAALLLAWLLRFAFLGRYPLSDQEAVLALQALGLAHGEQIVLGPQPAYLLLSAVWMFLFGSGNVVARFWPALVGGLAALAPLFLRRQLGVRPAIWLAFFLAVDPGLVALSRQAGSQSMVITFFLFAIGLWLTQRPVWAGVMAALALLSGPQIWPGVLAVAIAFWATGPREALAVEDASMRVGTSLRTALYALLAALLLVGSMFFIFPQGLSAMAASLPAYLQVWITPSGLPLTLLLAALLFYEFFPIVFGVAGLITGRNLPLVRFLGLWALVALLLAVIPTGRSMEGLTWVLLPLWILAARQMDQFFRVPSFSRLAVLGQMALASAIFIFISLDLLAILKKTYGLQDAAPELFAMLGALVLLLATTLLVAWGWNAQIARYGILWSLLLMLAVFTLAATWNASNLSRRGVAELWQPGSQFVDDVLLRTTIHDFDTRNLNEHYNLDTVVVGVHSPALQWSLRDVPRVQYVDYLSSTAAPDLVLTEEQPELALAATYRGQDFVLAQSPTWSLILPEEWLRWFYLREAPLEIQSVILWARIDLFPDDEIPAQANPDTQSVPGIQ